MGYANETGYTPLSIDELMLEVMGYVNTQFGTSYTEDTFLGTGFYKYFYALMQRVQLNEVKTSEIFEKLQDYFVLTNELISRPVNTNQGLIAAFEDAGFIASVKPMIEADAGKINICLDLDEEADDYEELKLEACTLIKDSTVGGVVSQGSESESIVLSNGQSFDFKFHLPNVIPVLLRLTITTSENNQVFIKSPDDIKADLFNNISDRYRLGLNFEPQRYYSLVDAPWASNVLLEWSDDDGDNYYSTVYDSDFDDLFQILLENIELVEE